MDEKQIEAAADWWAKVIGDAPQDNGDAHCNFMMSALKVRSEVSAEQRERFKVALAEKLAAKKPYCLGVDYHPDMILTDAAEEAGVEVIFCSTFPVKTSMWLDDGKVVVSCGYGAKAEQVYPPVAAAA